MFLVNEDEESDLHIVSDTFRRDDEVFVPVWEEPYVVAAPRTHRFASRTPLRAADLLGERFMACCNCKNAERIAELEAHVEVAAVTPTEKWAVALSAAGLGITILPQGCVTPGDDVAVLSIHDVNASRHVGRCRSSRPPEWQSWRRKGSHRHG